ncbi:MAG: ammonium transporter [Vulcanimicrobiaceae bacterium]
MMVVLTAMPAYSAAPAYLNAGDTAWQLTAATLVGLQSIPGLAILYGGLVKRKWALNSAMMCFYAFAAVMLVWALWAFNMGFGTPLHLGSGILGNLLGAPKPALDPVSQTGQAIIPLASAGMPPLHFAGSAMIYFQFVFAAIAPILIAGSVLGRMNFKAWMIFVPLWTTFVYSVGAFWLWGGGWLAQLGAVDYSGGYVIHVAAGVSGFVAAAMVGPRSIEDQRSFHPNNLIMALAGAGLLWLGWNGFNGGDPYFANADAAAAVLNTNIATAAALMTWLIADYFALGKPSVVSMVNGMIAGLVAITPGAGFVNGYCALLIGIAAGILPWLTLNKLGHLRFLKRVDDTFGVLHTHGVAGAVGGLMVGLVADPRMILYYGANKSTPPVAVTGWLFGNPQQFLNQLVALAAIVVFDAAMTFVVLKVVSLIVPLRASEGEVAGGDLEIHGYEATPPEYVPLGAESARSP